MTDAERWLEAVMLANEAGLRGTKVVGVAFSGVATSNNVFIIVAVN